MSRFAIRRTDFSDIPTSAAIFRIDFLAFRLICLWVTPRFRLVGTVAGLLLSIASVLCHTKLLV